ncbi:MAG: YicC family protein [Methylococcaceae bacterium]|nr:YicC family protein [Methylococcaceae bacterium]
MTAFAGTEGEIEGWSFGWEVRSVNHRYLDIALKLPESFRFLEAEARSRIGQSVKRGRLDVCLVQKKATSVEPGLQLDLELLSRLLAAAGEVEARVGKPMGGYSALDLIRWPGVLREAEVDRERIAPHLLGLLDEGMGRIVAVRAMEGAQLAELVETRCLRMREHIAAVQQRMPEVLGALRQKILARLAEVTARPDPDRLEQELVYLAQKLDVTEELDRLEAHIGETLRTLRQNEPSGRRLDFLLQEMNREANTLGSKSADAETTRSSVELKVLIEQMREQIQNIE